MYTIIPNTNVRLPSWPILPAMVLSSMFIVLHDWASLNTRSWKQIIQKKRFKKNKNYKSHRIKKPISTMNWNHLTHLVPCLLKGMADAPFSMIETIVTLLTSLNVLRTLNPPPFPISETSRMRSTMLIITMKPSNMFQRLFRYPRGPNDISFITISRRNTNVKTCSEKMFHLPICQILAD